MDNKNRDEYLSLDKYSNRPVSNDHKDFASFNHDGEHYFAMLSKGKPFLRSEGYSSAKARDNGISSVKKNRDNESRWKVEEKSGKYFLSLRAGNNQEIALSGAYDNKAAAESALKGWLSGSGGGAGLAAAAAAGAGAGAGSKDVLKDEDKEDDYLPTKEYEGKPVNDKKNNVALFKHENGQYYFALYDKNGKVKLRSEGFETAKNRDSELSGVIKYHNDSKMYQTLERGKFYMMVLKDEKGREVGRSPLLKRKPGAASGKTETKTETKTSTKVKTTGAAAASGLAAGKIISETRNVIGEKRNVIGEKRNVIGEKRSDKIISEKRNVIGEKRNVISETKSKIKEDDYLKCEAYKGHKITDEKNKIAKFKGADGQLYFVVYNKDGSVRLRSEGFKSDAGRNDELKQVIQHKENEKMYSTIKKGTYYINVLKDKTGREVGRSCATKQVAALVAPVAVAAAATTVVKKKEEKKVVKAVKKTPPPPKKVTPVPVKAAAPVAAKSGCAWWMWLLPLLLLLLFLLYYLGCFAAAPAAAVVPPPPPPPPPPVVEEVVVAPTKCDCAGLTHPVFTVPSGAAPKTTTRLGLAPEYGNLRGLDGSSFYNKLKAKYDGSASERRFLDGIFKQMGYENGFSDADASLFTSVNIKHGTVGNLGMKSNHKTVHRRLAPVDNKDLSAFRIEAKNLCHLHFMKTCGNHFFYRDCR